MSRTDSALIDEAMTLEAAHSLDIVGAAPSHAYDEGPDRLSTARQVHRTPTTDTGPDGLGRALPTRWSARQKGTSGRDLGP